MTTQEEFDELAIAVRDLYEACVTAFYEDLIALKTIVKRAVTWASKGRLT